MPEWSACVCMLMTWALGAWAGYSIGWRRGNALCPNDYVLRDVARQRDAMMRERDHATRERNEATAAASDFARFLQAMQDEQGTRAN